MTLTEAALVYAARLMAATNNGATYDSTVMTDTVLAIVAVTQEVQEVETLIRIARWESGGFRSDIASCKVRGDHGAARGIFQVHPFNDEEMHATCSADYRDQVWVALFHVHDSVAICKMHGWKGSELITIYTSGFCHKQDTVSYSHWGTGKDLQTLVYTDDNRTFSKKGILLFATARGEDYNESQSNTQ